MRLSKRLTFFGGILEMMAHRSTGIDTVVNLPFSRAAEGDFPKGLFRYHRR